MDKLQLALCGGGGGCGCFFMWCGDDCMLHLWWLYVVVLNVHGDDGHPSMAVVVLLYDCICAWCL